MSTELDDTHPAARESGPLLPSTISRFQVREKLGEGGNGIVYLAVDPTLDRNVAIKMLRRGGHPEASQRLLREAQSAAKLAHESVIVVHEVGTVDDQVYVAMEYVPGGTLTEWQRGKPWHDVLATYLRAGRGLAAAHAAGMVHRDFKPDNVLVAGDGRVRVTDFGLVSLGTARPTNELSLTQTGTVMGTPRYMAPEQHLGEDVDARADQFAFCAALYEALFGRAPFDGDTYGELADHVIAGELVPPPASSAVPAPLRAAIVRGLSRDRNARFASMDELLAALAPRVRRRRGWLVALAGVVVAAVVVFALVRSRHRTDPVESDETADDAMKIGEDAYGRGDFQTAAAAFKRAYALDPGMTNTPKYFFDIGQAYRQLGECAQASFAYTRYLALKPDIPADKRVMIEGWIKNLDDCALQQGSATR